MSQYLQPIFHNVIIHEKAVSDIIFLSVDRLKTKVTVYVQRVIVVLITMSAKWRNNFAAEHKFFRKIKQKCG